MHVHKAVGLAEDVAHRPASHCVRRLLRQRSEQCRQHGAS